MRRIGRITRWALVRLRIDVEARTVGDPGAPVGAKEAPEPHFDLNGVGHWDRPLEAPEYRGWSDQACS